MLLKGPTTIVCDPNGDLTFIRSGDQRLATAGSGDVLAGIMGALINYPETHLAAAAAHWHGRAAQLAKPGMTASDLPPPAPTSPVSDVLMNDTRRPTWCDIDLNALAHNYTAIKSHVGTAEVMPVVKADAYGHGITQVAQRLQQLEACLAVAYVEEGITLRKNGITTPIHVLGGAVERQIPLFIEHDLTFTAPSVDKLKQINEAAEAAKPLQGSTSKIDTGMERIGIHHYNADTLFEIALQCPSIEVEGVFSHFASADDPDLTIRAAPVGTILRRPRVLYSPQSANAETAHREFSSHLALPESHLDLVRPGLLLYGVAPTPEPPDIEIRPVLSWRTEVIYFKVVEAGSPVSYGGTWAPTHPTRNRHPPSRLCRWLPARTLQPSPNHHQRQPPQRCRASLHGPNNGRHRHNKCLQR